MKDTKLMRGNHQPFPELLAAVKRAEALTDAVDDFRYQGGALCRDPRIGDYAGKLAGDAVKIIDAVRDQMNAGYRTLIALIQTYVCDGPAETDV